MRFYLLVLTIVGAAILSIFIARDDGKPFKPIPPPKFLSVSNAASSPPLEITDNGRAVLTVMDADIPVGPCDFGGLVRAAKAHLDLEDPENFGIQGVNAVFIAGPCEVGRAAECRVSRVEEELARVKERAGAIARLRAELAKCESRDQN